jgi:hypothetical protein
VINPSETAKEHRFKNKTETKKRNCFKTLTIRQQRHWYLKEGKNAEGTSHVPSLDV